MKAEEKKFLPLPKRKNNTEINDTIHSVIRSGGKDEIRRFSSPLFRGPKIRDLRVPKPSQLSNQRDMELPLPMFHWTLLA